MTYTVLLTEGAESDLIGMHDYIALHDAPDKAEYVLGKIEEAFAGLSSSPNRGSYPKELLGLGIREYREVYFKPYRIIYRVLNGDVYVMMIADGRRDLQSLLQDRLLSA